MSDLRAVIYLLAGEGMVRWRRICATHVELHGYLLVSIVIDDAGGAKWASVRSLLDAGRVDVVVVAHRDHLPPDRLPRIEVANDEPTLNLHQRRPSRIRRDEEASR